MQAERVFAVFLALNLDYRLGQVLNFDTLTGTARYLVQVTIADREPIEAAGRVHDAWRLAIVTTELTDLQEARKHEATDLWVSLERPRRLLGARSKTFVGAVDVDLLAIEALRPETRRGSGGGASFDAGSSQHRNLSKS